MGRKLCLEPILPVPTPVAALRRSTCKPCSNFKTPLVSSTVALTKRVDHGRLQATSGHALCGLCQFVGHYE